MRPRRRRYLVIAVNPGDLFDEIFLDGDVESIRRRRDGEIVAVANERELQAREDVGNRRRGYGDAKQFGNACAAQTYRRPCRKRSDLVDERAGATAHSGRGEFGRELDR